MKTFLALCLVIVANSLAQARITNKQLLQFSKPADGSVKADHEVQLTGGLDDEVDFKSILKQMGHDFNFKNSKDEEVEFDVDIIGNMENFKNADGTTADLLENVKAGECACSGTTCVCCCVLAVTYEGKTYYIYLCLKITHTGSYFYVSLYWNGSHVYSTSITSPKTICYHYNSYLKGCAYIYYVSSTKVCLRLYFVLNGKTYSCSNHCLTLSASRFNSYLKKDE